MIIRPLFLIAFLCLTLFSFGQNTNVSRDITVDGDQINVELRITSSYGDFSEVIVDHYKLEEVDTIMYFSGKYNFEMADPSDFYGFEMGEEIIKINLGFYDNGNYLTIIRIAKENEPIEEIIIQ